MFPVETSPLTTSAGHSFLCRLFGRLSAILYSTVMPIRFSNRNAIFGKLAVKLIWQARLSEASDIIFTVFNFQI